MVLDLLLLLAALARSGVDDMLESRPGEVETFVIGGTEYAAKFATVAQHHLHCFAFELGILAKCAEWSGETSRTDFELEVLLVAVEMFIDILVECCALVEGDVVIIEKREPIFGPLFFVSRCKDTYYILNTQEKREKKLIFYCFCGDSVIGDCKIGAAKDGCDWDTKGSQAWLLLKQEDGERGRWVEDGAFGANYSLLGIAEVVKSGYLCTRKNENISNYE